MVFTNLEHTFCLFKEVVSFTGYLIMRRFYCNLESKVRTQQNDNTAFEYAKISDVLCLKSVNSLSLFALREKTTCTNIKCIVVLGHECFVMLYIIYVYLRVMFFHFPLKIILSFEWNAFFIFCSVSLSWMVHYTSSLCRISYTISLNPHIISLKTYTRSPKTYTISQKN